MSSGTTQFGLETVSAEEKAKRVDAVFTNVSSIYDCMNDAMSLGLHRLWKREAVVALGIQPQDIIADIACGSGDISELIVQKPIQKLICIDPNSKMLSQAQSRLAHHSNLEYLQSSAESLTLDTRLDKAIISFGLRNFSDPELGLKNIYQCLKPGGKLVIMEFNPAKSTWFEKTYEHYLYTVLPFLGKHIADDVPSYQYLADSIQQQPTPSERIALLNNLGYRYITYSPINGGIVGLFEAYR